MTGILVAAIIAGTFVWFWRRVEPLSSRLLDLKERALQIEEEKAKKPAVLKADPMPMDLVMFINQEAVGWAREEAQKKMWELYAEEGDWVKVRQRWHNE